MREELNLLAALMHKYLEPKMINETIGKCGYLPIDWFRDYGIYTEIELVDSALNSHEKLQPIVPKVPLAGEKSDGKTEEVKKEEKKKFLLNVPYIFSKID